MALSNWDVFAMTHEGKSCEGKFVSSLGVEVVIYKNWIYVRDEKAWQEGGPFIKNTVMEIYTADIQYKDVTIISRFIDNTIYLIVWQGYDLDIEYHIPFKGMVGIGTYGFDEEEYIGVTREQISKLKEITNTELDYFTIPKTFEKLNLMEGNRYNQGDCYLSKTLGGKTSVTKSEEKVEEPMLLKILKNV